MSKKPDKDRLRTKKSLRIRGLCQKSEAEGVAKTVKKIRGLRGDVSELSAFSL